ncbi:uncharacterized protein Bfra_004174 [Botrytis fragariae]|uniref:Uncharacterized protein n=1 Tax=Botrytis fragariae TaxID=1964551 RepID=A0A8H6AV45_9HELO|nr:uncharacterized protein Bfra_004174 [Botrytis fragariae]KAF5874167.1 hypothetical protein Bfra_004174 [Botrytis fragariae]
MAQEAFDEQDDLMALEEELTDFGESDMGLSDGIYISSPRVFTPKSPEVYQNLHVDFESPGDALDSNELLQFFNHPASVEYRKAIQTFNITGYHETYTQSANWTGITHLLVNLPNLSVLHWKISKAISPEILSNLSATNPDIRIYLHRLPRTRDPEQYYDEVSEDSIAMTNRLQEDARSILGSPLLYSLDADIMHSYFSNPASMRILFEILRSNPPNMRELQLGFSYHGCEFGNQVEAFPFLSSEFNTDQENMTSTKFPPLEKLVVGGYDFEESPDGGSGWYENLETPEIDWRTRLKFPWNKLPMWYIDWMGESHLSSTWGAVRHIPLERLPFPDGMSNLDVWLKVMDWSKLKTLHMKFPSPVAIQELGIAGALTALKELKVDGMQSPWEYDVKSEWETVVDFLEDIASNGTSLTSLLIRDIPFPKMMNCNNATTEYKATEKLLGALLRHTNLTKLHLYDGIQFPSWGSGSQLPKQIPRLASVLTLPLIEDLAIEMPSLSGSNFSNSENTNLKIDGIDPEISDEEMYKAFAPFTQLPRLKSVEFHVPAPECWRHQIKLVARSGTYERSGVEMRVVNYSESGNKADVLEVERCEREEEELEKRTRRLFEWMNGERERVGENAINRLRVVVGMEVSGWREGVEVEMLGRTSVGFEFRGETGVWECFIEEGEAVPKCEGGRKWRDNGIWG